MCISWNSWWRCSIARTSKICLDWHQKSDFELNSNIHLRHSCNQNMQNIVTWGQNMSANIEEFPCISMGGLFSGVPPWLSLPHQFSKISMDNKLYVSKGWGGMSTINIHWLQFKIQSHLQNRGHWIEPKPNKNRLKCLSLHLPFYLFLMKIL